MPDAEPRRRRLIVTADDVGLRPSWDGATARALDRGTVTSVSIVTTGPCYPDAAREVRRNGADHGVHLDLLDGFPRSPAAEIASLVDVRGRFVSLRRLLLRFAAGRVRACEVELEWGRQIERALDDGLRPTHLNAHFHLHVLPGLFAITARLAARFGIGWVRLPDEPPWFALRGGGLRPMRVARKAALWSLSRAQHSSARRAAVGAIASREALLAGRRWKAMLGGIRGEVTEVFCHPGQSDVETAALMSPELRRAIDGDFLRSSFRDLHGAS
jgi:predicted glycoside hydrolase/deacetylase ChbG (UPF0249 family)